MSPTFSQRERDFLAGQPLGRLATVDAAGLPQNNPVGFVLDNHSGQILIGGFRLGISRKFRNVQRTGKVALVVDELVSTDPWTIRGVEVRGTAEAVPDVDPPRPGMSRELIRITPTWIGSWGLESGQVGVDSRR